MWGSTTDTYALASVCTIQALEEEGYLFTKPLPATIRDSIRVCIDLKIRYLWIDRLCIVQDDLTSVKESQINAMGNIYNHSYLTLVDLEGVSMDHGLPGVSQARSSRITYQLQGMSLRARDDKRFEVLVTESKWWSRGWTFQEAMLSPRMLLFADAGVYFECSEGSHEDRFAYPSIMSLLFTPTKDYGSLVHNYTSRNFTFSGDVLKAFSGLMNWKYGSEHYFGLPYCQFERDLLWYPDTLTEDETLVPRSAGNGDIFPTWSWTSVMGSIQLPGDIHLSALLGVWSIPSSRSKELVHIIRPQNDLKRSWREAEVLIQGIGIAMAWKEGCFLKPLPPQLNLADSWEVYRAIITSEWTSVDKLNEEALGVASIQSKEDFERIFSSSYMTHAGQPGALLAHTQSLRARMVQFESPGLQRYGIEHYMHARLHSMCDAKVDVWIQPNPAHWQFLDHDYSRNHIIKLDMLALSMRHVYLSPFESQERGKQGRWYDSEGSVLSTEDREVNFLVDVLLVETRDGLSRRVAIGIVELHDWISASPEFRDFTLV
ncbi:hypothetical protein AAWM_04961 [Aspergillus awamori]|uniref:Heterokaryon incompatibility domain-containing protein n=1 Tax=Aspergillus awamori TaxID=105351 RepID=A0A401KS10_ASPAW|nr:hypothetical protein AAWM_04961 [Aspergillus awamori]